MSRHGALPPLIERRLTPIGGPGFGIAIALAAMATGLLLGGLLFIPFDSARPMGTRRCSERGSAPAAGLATRSCGRHL